MTCYIRSEVSVRGLAGLLTFSHSSPTSTAPLTVLELTHCIDHGAVTVPPITEVEIVDRSKSDGFNKAVVVSQLLWFVSQFMVRVVYKLAPTRTLLETETLGLVTLNFITWGFWWEESSLLRRLEAGTKPTSLGTWR
ncbi:hypothetical protein BDN67DRAFT_127802 [Paxillus ammoniavirescens]|nr:hypothetical protein BDN67DRAFT_127802 [Paxillus ammoniavirescens]